jgi:hypothetical protein
MLEIEFSKSYSDPLWKPRGKPFAEKLRVKRSRRSEKRGQRNELVKYCLLY